MGDLIDQRRQTTSLKTVVKSPKSTVPMQVLLAYCTKLPLNLLQKQLPFPSHIIDVLYGSSHRIISLAAEPLPAPLQVADNPAPEIKTVEPVQATISQASVTHPSAPATINTSAKSLIWLAERNTATLHQGSQKDLIPAAVELSFPTPA